mmetsp:Transcript_34616/g.62765  ORF Transcript_34616/g.62765 Transcript_34616/m.62765 type:complete len:327 (-) Transcript_34616:237-1217(-)
MLSERSKVLSVSELLTWGKIKSNPAFELGCSDDLFLESNLKDEVISPRGEELTWMLEGLHAQPLDAQALQRLWPRSNTKAIFLDYDGTLREFESQPELAVPTPDVHRLLAALNDRHDLVVHIISGRDAEFLNHHFGIYNRIKLIAEHERRVAGRFQVWRPDSASRWTESSSSASWKRLVRQEMSKASEIDGCCIEEKASGLVWHYRGVADEDSGVALASSLVERLEHLKTANALDVKITSGNKMVEVSCRNVTKGDVMRRICDDRAALQEPFEAVLVAGDDVSDESMFQAAAHNFLTIKVGGADSHARFYVPNPAELRSLLWQLAR